MGLIPAVRLAEARASAYAPAMRLFCLLLSLVGWLAGAAGAHGCPVRILDEAVRFYGAPDAAAGSRTPQPIEIENRHDSLDLLGYYLQISWRDGKDGAEIGGETLALPATPPGGRARLTLRARDDYATDAAFVHLTIRNPSHEVVGTCSLPVLSSQDRPVASRRPPPRRAQVGDQWRLSAAGVTFTLNRDTGQLLRLEYEGGLLNLFGPALEVAPLGRFDAFHPPHPPLLREGRGLELGEAEPPQTVLERVIDEPAEVGGVWRTSWRFSRSGWPAYVEFLSAQRIALDREGRLTIHYAHTYLGRDDGMLARWGTAVGVVGPRTLTWHGGGPGDAGVLPPLDKGVRGGFALPGVHVAPLAAGKTLDPVSGVSAFLVGLSSTEGITFIPHQPASLSVSVDGRGRASLGVASLANVAPRAVRSATGAILLARERGHWWQTPAPSDWPERDDGDAWPTALELLRGTNPFLADSDGDGVLDSDDPAPLDPDVPTRRRPTGEELARVEEPPHRGPGWLWMEAEDCADVTGASLSTWSTNFSLPDFASTTSRGACLWGFQHPGALALAALRFPATRDGLRLALRYALDATGPAHLVLRLTHPGGEVEHPLLLESTGGDGSRMEHWRLHEVPVGTVKAGIVLIEWTAPGGGPPLALDGFYLYDPYLQPRAALEGNLAPPPR
ncbi:hypothetical protein HS125_00220 [bacterium]|nr:hypothetical protein [bacterium]